MDGLERRGVLKLIESIDDLTLKLAYKDLIKLRERGNKDSYIQGFIYIIEDEMMYRSMF